MLPGGFNPLHIHLCSMEIGFSPEGNLMVSNNNIFFSHMLQKGDLFFIPRGLVHFQYNVGSTNTVAITTFNGQLPGAQLVAPSFFGSTPTVPMMYWPRRFISTRIRKLLLNSFPNRPFCFSSLCLL